MKRNILHEVSNLSASVLCALSLQAVAQPSPVWQSVTIPGLAAGSTLGGVWARTRDEAYVWVQQNLGGGNYNCQLYRWNGSQWYRVLDSPGYSAGEVHGVGVSEVFAASSGQVWRSTNSAQSWTLQPISTTGSAPM